MVSFKGAFAKWFTITLLVGIGVILFMFILSFVILGPLFTQLFGEIIYFGYERIWIYGLLVILFTFGLGFAINYFIAGQIGGIKYGRD